MMSSSKEDAQFRAYKDDSRIPCQYGVKCYQKNPQHHNKYKHPPKRETAKQQVKNRTGTKRKQSVKNVGNKTKAQSESPERKLQKTSERFERNLHTLSPSPTRSDDSKSSKEDEDENSDVEETEASNNDNKASDVEKIEASNNDNKNSDVEKTEASNDDITPKEIKKSPSPIECKTTESVSMSDVDTRKAILDLFLVEMPKDFFQFYDFCKGISKGDPLSACKSVRLKLVGPYDVLENKIKYSESKGDRDRFLTHWRYYYDPPEFQTIIRCDDKEGLHFGYWRDDVTEKLVFVAKNRANVNCVFEAVAENIFGAVDAYLQDKAKSANPFEKTAITRLQSQLKNFAKQHDITLERNTVNMKSREKQVVARTFYKIGIVVPYNKKTQLGYRDLAASDSDLQKILKQVEEAGTPEERKAPLAKLDEVVRLATIAADECDFGTCLELGHDLFSNGSVHVQSRGLQMLSIAYTHLQRPQLLKILEAHLKNRKKGCELSAL
ncbi:histone PARylation factor 1 [Ooceraea biroi]|uniref:PBZ-type domain-containing protein n=1 Tax=Ooceraea biroi TaxID=2015173 RepID=A0A026WXL8_OOCBI|nr:histone PARylation factor 1 [Ooceraea biroi]XP_011352427.1 histone PARylation factor 1 [Ooceraea biroi]EZA60563.1 hypothetical protein X777_14589 [Ooceraea biroi]